MFQKKSVSNLSFVVTLFIFFQPFPLASQEEFQTFVKPSGSVKEILASPSNKTRADTYYILALSYSRRGILNEAYGAINRGLKIERNNIRLLNLRAALWARDGRIREAIIEFRRVLNMYPNDAYAKDSLDSIYKTLKKLPTSVLPPNPISEKLSVSPVAPVVETALNLGTSTKILESNYFIQVKNKQQCYYGMAAIKRAQEIYVKGKSDLGSDSSKIDGPALLGAKLLQSMPICPEKGEFSWKGGGPSCSKHGDFSALESEVNTVFKDFNRGLKAKLGRNYSEAQKAFDQVVVLYPRWSEAYFQLGDTLFRMGNDKPALENLKKCLKIDSSHLDAKLLLANLYFKTGHKDSALDLLDAVVKNVPNTVYGLSARSISGSIRSGKNYYQIFPPY
ncbi:tetratricopeptide repeat protein [bacterium]|nr:tetratricopeptide repeat protein [bacterium]